MVLSGFFILMLMFGSLYSFGVFLKPLLDELGYPQKTLSGVYSLCFLLSGVLAMLMGRLNDRVGPRVVVALCSPIARTGPSLSDYLLPSQNRLNRPFIAD